MCIIFRVNYVYVVCMVKIVYMYVSNVIYRRLKYRYISSNVIVFCVLDGMYMCVYNYVILII